jgi:hypothetical protein
MLIFLAIHGLTEAISVAPVYPNLVLNIMAVRIALVKPFRDFAPESSTLGSSPFGISTLGSSNA